jgi:hypothetical protein
MTYNIKSTSVETRLMLQKLDERAKHSEAVFFQLRTFLDALLFK